MKLLVAAAFINLVASGAVLAASGTQLDDANPAPSISPAVKTAKEKPIQLAQAVTNFNVTKVWYRGGTFEKVGGRKWVERNRSTFSFVETGRNRNWVELTDRGRDVVIYLAVQNRVINISQNGGPIVPLYNMTRVQGSGGAPAPQVEEHCHNGKQRHSHSGHGRTLHSHYQKNCEINIRGGGGDLGDPEENCIKVGRLKICN